MRILAVIAGLLAGLLLQSLPAAAHGAEQATGAVESSRDAQPAKTSPVGVCEIDVGRLETFVTAKRDDGMRRHGHPHNAAAKYDPSQHDPTDHSHAFGEAGQHQLMSHGGHDLAAQAEKAIAPDQTLVRSCAATTDDPSLGIAIPPPVPPPLG